MPNDIRLEPDAVVVEGNRVKVEGEELHLRSPTRLKQVNRNDFVTNKPRRALVHGDKDQLIVNYQKDYSTTEVHGTLTIKTRNVPAAIYLQDKNGNTEIFMSMGLVDLKRDLTVSDLAKLSGSRSLLKTLNWLEQRVKRLEKKAGLPPAGKIPQTGRG